MSQIYPNLFLRGRCLSFVCALIVLTTHAAVFAQQKNDSSPESSKSAPDSGTVWLTVSVIDAEGNPITGLNKEAFIILEGKTAHEITALKEENGPVNVGFVFDMSRSVWSGNKSLFTPIRRNILHFKVSGHEANEYFLLSFTGRLSLLTDWTRSAKAIVEGLNSLTIPRPTPSTSLYDACYASLEKAMSGPHSRSVILLISDGIDTSSHYHLDELRRQVKQTNVIIYSIGFQDQYNDYLGRNGPATLREFSSLSGGKAFFPVNEAQVNEAFERIGLMLKHQYLLGFKPAGSAKDGKWHSIKIKVTPPPGLQDKKAKKLTVLSREGYY